jgi:hypothetical protein
VPETQWSPRLKGLSLKEFKDQKTKSETGKVMKPKISFKIKLFIDFLALPIRFSGPSISMPLSSAERPGGH